MKDHVRSPLLCAVSLVTGAQAQTWDSGWNPPWLGGSGDGSGSGSSGSGNGNSGSGQGGDGGNGFGSFQNGAGFDVDQAMSIRQVHGVLAAIAFVGLFPIGAILMRVIPGRFAWIIHGVFQILAYGVYIAAAALGIQLMQLIRIPLNGTSILIPAQANRHPIIGLVLLGFFFFQPLLGWLHHIRLKKTGRRTAWSHLHLWLGRGAIVLGIVNGGLGLQLANASDSAITAYSVVAAVVCLLWLLSALVSEYRRWRTHRKAAPDHAFQPPPAYDVPPPYTHTTAQHGPGRPGPSHPGDDIEMSNVKQGRRNSTASFSSIGSGRVAHP
ncbi:cytochrome b561 and DOMON domain-containing protein [Apiospora kogelbergensis]|uniref:Cytochrome b561 and DOMON domain-containing protein n=1 Tax=Apiospora kogelbergensis TaxID=1337665 RepID=A0AAW0QW52_9PEZI